jgi:hypothetical protein
MKHSWKLLAVMTLMPIAVMAQTSLDAEVNAELEKMYKEQTAASTASAPAAQATAVQAAAAPAATAAPAAQAPVPQPTVVQTQTVVAPASATVTAAPAMTATQVDAQAVKQPTTVIEASPLTESGAERLRKARQEAELYTEQNIVQKLEQSRLEDEKKRADVLFGDKFKQLNEQQNQQPAAPAVVAAPVAVQQVTAPVAAAPEEKQDNKVDKEQIRSEVSAALADLKAQAEEKPKAQNYIGVLGGGGSYPDAKNVRGQYAAGVSVGKKFDDRLVVEGTFMYSNYQVDQTQNTGCVMVDPYTGTCYPRITNMNQYAGQALVKYQLFSGTIRPEIGALGAYTYRTFSDSQFSMSNSTASSNALDAGVMTGASLELTDKFSVGLDFRYMWNLTYKTSGLQPSFQQSFLGSSSPIETMNYYTVNLVGRFAF